jgi:hypothetical protein
MRTILLFVISIFLLTLLFLFYRFTPSGITGFYPKANISVGVNQKVKGDITALIYERNLNFTQIQDIMTEFTNVGSTTLTARIEVRVYLNNQSRLQEMAYYYDSQAVLKSGNQRTYSVSFLPPYVGLYFIKARAPYDSKAVERWGSFFVSPPPTVPSVEVIIPEQAAPSYAIVEKVRAPSMILEYPETVKIKQGESKLFNIIVKNTGNLPLSNLKLYISTTSLLDIEINPKQVFKLVPNQSTIFLISVNTSEKTPVGNYSFDFQAVSDEVREEKSILLEIVSEIPSIVEDINETILNYEYIISEIQHEINYAALKGIDVKLPQDTLNKAIESLEKAKEYYQQGKYEDARSKLAEVKKYLEEAVYQLAVAGIVIKMPAFIPTYIIIFIVITIIGLFLILFILLKRRQKEKEKRPKLLSSITETET